MSGQESDLERDMLVLTTAVECSCAKETKLLQDKVNEINCTLSLLHNIFMILIK